MNIDISTLFKYSFVISYDNNRIEQMEKIFKHHNLPMPRVISAFHNKMFSGPVNCSLSHGAVVKMAKAFDMPFVLIFEDDAYPRDNIKQSLESSLLNINDNTNVIILGWSKIKQSNEAYRKAFKDNQLLLPFDNCINYGSHSYILFKAGYDEYLQKLFKYTHPADRIFDEFKSKYITKSPMFIQYCKEASMNGHYGYILNGSKKIPPDGFSSIEEILK